MRIKYCKSIKGTSEVNQDVIGSSGNYFWVFDGATDLYGLKVFEPYDDVNYVVNLVSDYLKNEVKDDLPLNIILKNTLEKVKTHLQDTYKLDLRYPYKLPTFTIVFIRVIDLKLEYLILGDSSLVVERKILLSDARLANLVNETKPKVLEDDTKSEKLKKLRKIRKKLNTSRGYWIGSLDSKGIDEALSGTINLSKNDTIALYTDGFSTSPDIISFKFTKTNIEKRIKTLINSENLRALKKRDDLSILVLEV